MGSTSRQQGDWSASLPIATGTMPSRRTLSTRGRTKRIRKERATATGAHGGNREHSQSLHGIDGDHTATEEEQLPNKRFATKDWVSSDVTFYAAFTLAAILLLTAAEYWLPNGSVWSHLAKEFGFAGIVAIILVATIERFTRRRHENATDALLDRMKTNLFQAVYTRYIPESVFEEVEKVVLRADVCRSAHELDYTIDSFADSADEDLRNNHFSCTAQTRYTLTNVRDEDIRHEVVVRLERPLNPAWDHLCKVDELFINGAQVPNLEKHLDKTDEHIFLKYPMHLSARATVDIATKSTLIKKKTDQEVWCSRLPSDGLKLTVMTPSKLLTVRATANHSEKLKCLLRNPVTTKWELDFGIFPYQSITFWWVPTTDKP